MHVWKRSDQTEDIIEIVSESGRRRLRATANAIVGRDRGIARADVGWPVLVAQQCQNFRIPFCGLERRLRNAITPAADFAVGAVLEQQAHAVDMTLVDALH